jgi:hypothetical protein
MSEQTFPSMAALFMGLRIRAHHPPEVFPDEADIGECSDGST